MQISYGNIASKSFYISRAVSNFHGAEFEIWAGLRSVDSTEKKQALKYFLGQFFHVFMGTTKLSVILKYEANNVMISSLYQGRHRG